MKYLATAFFLLTMMMITVSCSKDDGNNVSTNSSAPREKGEKDDQGEKNNKGNKNDIYNVGQYEYYGTWKINDSTVVADDFGWLWYEYCSQIPDSYIDPYHPNSFGICFSTQIDPYVSYQEFPIKPLVHHFFPEADIAHVVFATQISGGPSMDKWTILFNITHQYEIEGDESANSAFLLSWLNPTGHSDNALYYELIGSDASAYIHFTVVVTTKDEDYFGLSFNIVPHKSLLVFDRQTEMITFSLNMPSIDIIDKDFTRTTRQLSPEYTITYNSHKIIRHNVGN